MRIKMALVFSAMIPASVLASTPLPYAGQCALLALLSKLLATGDVQPQTKVTPLELVEHVALGRTATLSADAEEQVGLMPSVLRQSVFSTPEVRACALRAMGVSEMPEAEVFLTNLKQDDIGPDSTQLIWPAAQTALLEMRFRRISDPQAKIVFLEHTLTESHDAISNSAVQTWAVEQLCNRGALISIPLVQRSIKKRISGQRGEDEIRFCETRMQVVSHDSDRAKAVGSVLTLENGENNERLTRWAINELVALHSSKADAELDRFADEIGKLPLAHPWLRSLAFYRQEIQQMQRARPK